MSTLAQRYSQIQDRIDRACQEANRSREGVSLIVVSKFHPVELVLELYDLGQLHFGENKDQEAGPKALALANILAARTPQPNMQKPPHWHFVGQLQSNKVKSVLRYASSIHSLDRASLLNALAKETQNAAATAQNAGLEPRSPIDVFIELNLTDNPERGGIRANELEEFAAEVLQVSGVNLVGVMGVASLETEPERDFALIAAASQRLQSVAPDAKSISAGMSQDFELAIGYGATHLRVGTAITGQRQYTA